MEEGSIYGGYLPEMEQVREELEEKISQVREEIKEKIGMDPVEHCLSRIKSEESMREKCIRKNLPVTAESALSEIHDAIGFRIVCAFRDDIKTIRDRIAQMPDCEVVQEKDYIQNMKPNGYRSYHMILRFRGKFFAEIQLRTISMDTWAALEHHLKYKNKEQKSPNDQLIVQELKRCANELAATDLTLQTLRDMIMGSVQGEKA